MRLFAKILQPVVELPNRSSRERQARAGIIHAFLFFIGEQSRRKPIRRKKLYPDFRSSSTNHRMIGTIPVRHDSAV